jgi:hypothetical protein
MVREEGTPAAWKGEVVPWLAWWRLKLEARVTKHEALCAPRSDGMQAALKSYALSCLPLQFLREDYFEFEAKAVRVSL